MQARVDELRRFRGRDVLQHDFQRRKIPHDARELAIDESESDYVVNVRPELVVEVRFNDVQRSPRYPGGIALRFARVKRYRSDKTAAEADTFATIQSIYQQTTGQPPPVR